VETYQAPRRIGEDSNLYVEDPWKDVKPVTILTDSPPYNPQPSYNPDFSSFTSDFDPPVVNPFEENSYQPDHYKPQASYSPKPSYPEISYSPEPNHHEPEYNPEPYQPQSEYSPKPNHVESTYNPEPYHPEPTYSHKPYESQPTYDKPYKPEEEYNIAPYHSKPESYHPKPEPYHTKPESYHTKPKYKPKSKYHYKKPTYRPPIGSKPYKIKPHDKVSVAKPSYKPEPQYEPEVHTDTVPYHQPYHENVKYHDKNSDVAPAPVHDIPPLHEFSSYGQKHQDSYHEPPPTHYIESHTQTETHPEPSAFFTHNHELEDFHEFNPGSPINPFSSVRKSDSESDSLIYKKSQRPRMTRRIDRYPGHKDTVTYSRPSDDTVSDHLPFLDPQPGGFQEQFSGTKSGFLDEFSIPDFETFRLKKENDIEINSRRTDTVPTSSYSRRNGSRDSRNMRISDKLFPTSDKLSESASKSYGA